MSKWRVYKLTKDNGKSPFDKWYGSLTVADQANVDDAITFLESVTTIPPEKVKKYKDLFEIKIYGNKTALRPLALKDGEGRLIIILMGTTKKGKIADGTYEAALKLAKAYGDGDYSIKGYWED